MRPASAPIPSQLRTAVKLIMPLPAEASARKPMPTTAATGLRFKPRMAVRNLLTTVPPNAKRLIPIIAETAMRSPRLTAASRFTATASQSAKWLIRTTVITGPRQSPLVRQTQPALILPTVLPKSNPGPVTQAMRNPVTLALSVTPVPAILKISHATKLKQRIIAQLTVHTEDAVVTED